MGKKIIGLLWLLAVVLCLHETRVWGFAATPQPASGVFAPANPLSIGENYDGWQYDASDSSLAARGTVPTIGGRAPINSKYAGQTHPSGVRFNDQGFPDFGPHSKAQVQIDGLTGNPRIDNRLANQAAGFGDSTKAPKGYVWHHVEDGRTMQLVPIDIHTATRHTGGAAVIRSGGFD